MFAIDASVLIVLSGASMSQTINISLPAELRDYVLRRMEEDKFANVSEYFRSLIREDRRRSSRDRLERLLLEGLASGERKAWGKDVIEDIRRRGKAATKPAPKK